MSRTWQVINCGEPVEFDAHVAAGIRTIEERYSHCPFYGDSRDEARFELYRLKQTLVEIP